MHSPRRHALMLRPGSDGLKYAIWHSPGREGKVGRKPCAPRQLRKIGGSPGGIFQDKISLLFELSLSRDNVRRTAGVRAQQTSERGTHMTRQFAARLWLGIYVLTTLASALLLFEVQPIISKFILPWFGGSPAVWTTCMVFFQTLLFGGYAYAHLSEKYLRPRTQAVVHIGLLTAAAWLLPIAPDASWKLDAQSGADVAHPVPADGIGGLALLRALGHWPIGAGLVLPIVSRPFALSTLCDLEFRLAGGAGGLSVLRRAALCGRPAGLDLGRWFRSLCRALRHRCDVARRLPVDRSRRARQPAIRRLCRRLRPGGRERLAWLALPALASMMLWPRRTMSARTWR